MLTVDNIVKHCKQVHYFVLNLLISRPNRCLGQGSALSQVKIKKRSQNFLNTQIRSSYMIFVWRQLRIDNLLIATFQGNESFARCFFKFWSYLCLAGCRNWGYPFWTICWSRLPAIHHTRLFRQVNPVHIQTYLSKTLVMVRAGGGGRVGRRKSSVVANNDAADSWISIFYCIFFSLIFAIKKCFKK